MLARTMHSIVYDAEHDEIVVPNAFSYAVLTFRGGADGEEAPIRVIQVRLSTKSGPPVIPKSGPPAIDGRSYFVSSRT